MEPINDPLWEIAKSRTKFKKRLISFIIVIPFLWCIWFFSEGTHARHFIFDDSCYWHFNLPWPAWVTLFWGFGLACKFVAAYVFNTKQSIESEYEALKNKHK